MSFSTLDEIRQRNSSDSSCFLVVVDSYVLDLKEFLPRHPGGSRKIVDRRDQNVDISTNFLDHFGHTVRAFREACREYDHLQRPVVLKF